MSGKPKQCKLCMVALLQLQSGTVQHMLCVAAGCWYVELAQATNLTCA